jgi:hypothetical protein
VWTDNLQQGYVRLVLTPTAGSASFIAVSTITSPHYRTRPIGQWRLTPGTDCMALDRI